MFKVFQYITRSILIYPVYDAFMYYSLLIEGVYNLLHTDESPSVGWFFYFSFHLGLFDLLLDVIILKSTII